MKKRIILMMITAVLVVSLPVLAATVAHWDFEDGVAGEAFTPDGAANGSGYTEDIMNGYRMYGWDDYWGPYWSDFTPTGAGLAMRNADNHQDGYATNAALTAWSPSIWTIECAVYLNEMGGWETMIGRDGSTPSEIAADFYLSNDGEDDTFRINVMTVGGTRWILDSDFVPVIEQWYRIAVTSDGVTINMYCDKMDGNGFVSVGSLDISAQSVADNALAATDFQWTFGRGWYDGGYVDHIDGYMDDVRFSDVVLSLNELLSNASAYGPNPAPLNEDGSVGTLDGSDAQVTLNFKAGMDPNSETGYPVNPDVVTHYVRLGTNPETLPVYGTVTQVHNADPNLTDPNNSYGTITLIGGSVFYWQVEEGLDNGTGTANPAGDPNNILGPVWSFTTVAATPTINSGPVNTVADASGNATLTVSVSASVDSIEWYKVGTPDVKLTDGGIYSTTDTTTLTITGMTEADEAQYYAIAYHGLTPSDPSPTAQVWVRRLMNHYPFETKQVVGSDTITPDIKGGYDAVLMSEEGVALPDLSDANQLELGLPGSNYALLLENGDHDTDPNGQYAQIPEGILAYQDMTISVWFLVKDYLPYARIWDFGNGTSDYLTFTPDNYDYDIRFSTRLGDGAIQELLVDYGPTDFIAAGSWNQIVVTLSGDTGRLYRNGELVLTGNITIDPIDISPVLNYIGKSQWEVNNDPEFSGLIDDLKIYNYAKTSQEIAAEYVAIAGGWVCNNEIADLLHDFNNDCRVNLADFAFVAAEWLECQRVPVDSCLW